MSSRNQIIISLPKIRKNLQVLEKLTPRQKHFVVVKADAYGMGALPVARYLEKDADFFCVALPEEAKQLSDGGIHLPILCLGYFPDEWMPYYAKNEIRPAIYDLTTAVKYNDICKDLGVIGKIHLAVDTGHSRIGFAWNDASTVDAIEQIASLSHLEIEGVFSHFAVADEEDSPFTKEQLRRFLSVTEQCRSRGISMGIRHLANDAGVLLYPESHLDGVRMGICIYGEFPSSYVAREAQKKGISILPVFGWKAAVSHVKEISKGTPVSYGGTWKAPRDSRIATIQAGYGDGYSRLFSNQGYVLLGNPLQRCPIVGRVCMDQLMVDITELWNTGNRIARGDTAWLLLRKDANQLSAPEPDQISAEELAQWSQTIHYEVLCGISSRVDRVYLK